jgi:hypothetical protein
MAGKSNAAVSWLDLVSVTVGRPSKGIALTVSFVGMCAWD